MANQKTKPKKPTAPTVDQLIEATRLIEAHRVLCSIESDAKNEEVMLPAKMQHAALTDIPLSLPSFELKNIVEERIRQIIGDAAVLYDEKLWHIDPSTGTLQVMNIDVYYAS